MKKKAILTLAAVLAIGASVPSFGAITFKDINNVPWSGAQLYIERAADLELMVGEEKSDGRYFKARDNVTCFETIQLIYNMMKKTNNLGNMTGVIDKWSFLLQQIGVPQWARESMSFALERGIVTDVAEAKKFIGANGKSIYATREAAAIMLAKAMDVRHDLLPNAKLSFKDSAKVNANSVPYVEMLFRLGIMQGDTNNNFNPKTAINRAEMAAVVTRAYDKMLTAEIPTPEPTPPPVTPPTTTPTKNTIASGIVVGCEVRGGSIMVTIAETAGQRIGLFADSNTVVTNTGGGRPVYSALSIGDGVANVVYDAADIKSLTITYDANPNEDAIATTTITGRIDEITNEKVYLTNTAYNKGYYLSTACVYTLGGREKSQKDFINAAEDDYIDVEMTLNSKEEVVKMVGTVKEGAYQYGVLRKVTDSYAQIKRSKSASSYDDYDWASRDVVLQLEDRDSSISKIRAELEDSTTLYVKYMLNSDDEIKKLYASEDSYDDNDDDDDDYITGYFSSLTKSVVKVKVGSSVERYDIADDCRFKLEGRSSTVTKINDAYDDAYDDDDDFYLRIELEDDEAILVEASEDRFSSSSSSSSSTKYTGTADELTSSYISFRKDGSSSYKEYDLADDVTYLLDDDSSTRTKVRNAIDDEGDVDASIYLDRDDEVTKVSIETGSSSSNARSGQIKSLSSSRIEFKKTNKSYDLITNCSFIFNGDRDADIGDINEYVGDDDVIVEADITMNNERVTKVDARLIELSGTVTRLNNSRQEIDIRTPDGNKFTINYNSSKVKVKGDYSDISDMDRNYNDRNRKMDVVITMDNMMASVIDVEKI